MNTQDVHDVTLNILAGMLLFLAGAASARFAGMWRFRQQRKVWKPLSGENELGICLTTRAGPLPRSTRRVSLAEVRGLATLIPVLSRLKISYRLIEADAVDAQTLSRMNLLAFGSTFVNDISREIIDFLNPTVGVSFTEDPREIIVSGKGYRPTYSSDASNVVSDHALIIRTHNPYDPTHARWALLVMGCHGFGTEGALQALLRRELIHKILAGAKTDPFIALVRIRIIGRVYDVQIVETRPLDGL